MPELKLYNTLTREKEVFEPLMKDPTTWKKFVGMYSCWPTVYSTPHIGNFRATFTADLIRNTLKYFWYPVKAVMNITDVGHLVSDADDGEDKLEKGSRIDGISAWDVAKKYEDIFLKAMQELRIERFDVMPRATEHIQEQIQMVESLERQGYTYTIPDDGIYMDTSLVEDYGKLMGSNYKKRLADLNAGERVDIWGKRNSTDFALWKFSPKNEKRQMERDSPWGIWFPGWHIECSAMASKYLGEQFDIHHGGTDHITVHHSNEITQSECSFWHKPWVKYWLHNEFLQVDGGKMSKSLGNIYSLDDIKAKGYSPLDLRYFYFKAQYSNFLNFTRDALEQARSERLGLIKKIKNLVLTDEETDFQEKVYEALWDNLNTPKLFSEIHTALQHPTRKMLALLHQLEVNVLKVGLFDQVLDEEEEIPAEVLSLAEKRKEAKAGKDYALADQLREKIADLGWEIKDEKDGFSLTKK